MDIIAQSLQLMGQFLIDPMYWLILVLVVLIAGPFGLIPGVGSTTLVAIALPFLVLNMEPAMGMVVVAGLISLGNTMDSIPAVLLGYPGPATQVTFLEGHQLARRGEAARTLGAVYVVSAIGGVVGALILALAMPAVRPFIINFAYPEIAAMAIFGIVMVSILSRGAMVKGLASATLGVLFSTIGLAPLQAFPRFNMGWVYLLDGLPLIPVVIGLFALPEIIDLSMSRQPVARGGVISNREVLIGARIGLRSWKIAVRQSVFGVILGAIPGIGAAVIDWMSYALGIALSKDKSQFGKGSLDGVLFAESAQNAKEAGQAVPTLAFGIPGGALWAIALAALLAFNVAPGIGMLGRNLNITIGVVLTIGLGNLLITLLALAMTAQLAKLTLIPYAFVGGTLLPLLILGAFQATFAMGDIVVLLAAAAVGLAMKWHGWPRPPFILGFVLGPVLERNLWTALNLRADGAVIFLTRPYALAILILAVVFAVALIWMMRTRPVTAAPAAVSESEDEAGAEAPGQPPRGAALPEQEQAAPRFALRWQWEYLFWLVLLGWVGGVVFRESLRYTGSTQFLPLWASVAFVALMAVLFFQSLKPHGPPVGLMDLGMRTGTDRAALLKLLPMVGWLGGFLLAMGLIGFQASAILFPAAFILANARLRGRQIFWVLVPVGLLSLVVFGVMEYIMHVWWPDRFLWDRFFR